MNKQLSINLFQFPHWSALLAIAVVSGLVAGSYPAFYLSSFNPVFVLKGIKIKTSGSAVFVRKGLVITQFTASVILIVCTVIIYQQVQHIRNRDLGYTRDQLLYMDLQGNMKKNFEVLKTRLLATGYVENAATSLHDALHVYSHGNGYSWQGKDPDMKVPIHSNVVSPEYLSTMHMQLISGRDFYPTPGVDSTNWIINESMAKLMGKEGKVGCILTSGQYHGQVAGIIKDFVYNDIYGPGAPLVLFPGLYGATIMALWFKQNAPLSQALAATESLIAADNPGHPFEYKFADESFDALFSTETLIGKLAGIFATLAVFISCLGLFGLAESFVGAAMPRSSSLVTFATARLYPERRAKEIGIRKVLGASAQGLAALLSREFAALVTLSCGIALPIAWWIFAMAGGAALLIALVTVSFQTVRAALTNPIKSLRTE